MRRGRRRINPAGSGDRRTVHSGALGRSRVRKAILVLAVLGAAGCSEPSEPPTVATVRVTPTSLAFVSLGETEQLSAVGVDDGGSVVSEQVDSWTTSDDAVVVVAPDGRVTAVGNGLATIRATIAGVSGGADVRVDQDVAAITLSPATSLLTALGETVQIDLSVEDAGGSEVTDAHVAWSSSDPAVVTVDDSGLARAVANGVARVRAGTPSVSGSADLEVDQAAVELAFTVQPSEGLSEGGFDPPVEVSILDALGSLVVDESSTVELSFASNATGAQLQGVNVSSSVNGVSVFPDLAIDRAGTEYRLEANAEGLPPDTSVAFRIRRAPFAYVADNEDANVSVLNVATGERVAVIPVGQRPYGVAASPDGSLVYVSNGLSNSVSVVETGGNTVVATVPVGDAPREVAMTPDGFALVVHANVGQDSVWYIDTSDQTVAAKAEVAKGNEGIAVSSDGARALVPANADGMVSVLDVAARLTLTDIVVGGGPRRVAMAPDGLHAYVTLYQTDQLALIDVPSGTVLDTIDLSNNPVDVAVTPEGSRIFVTHFPFSTTVSVIDAEARTVVASISLAGSPHSVTMGPYGEFAYVTHDPSSVSVIELETLEVISTLEVGANPLELAVILTGSSR